MKYLQPFINSLLLCTVPSFSIHPQDNISEILEHSSMISNMKADTLRSILDYQTFSYDDVLNLIEALEEGTLERNCSVEELERINQFIIFLVQQGMDVNEVDNASDLESDIQGLLKIDRHSYEYAYYLDGMPMIIPAVSYGQGDILLCKSKIKEKWEKTKDFVKKHKTAIIVGAVIVLATGVIVYAIVASGSAAAVATTATTAAASAAGAVSAAYEDNQAVALADEAGARVAFPQDVLNEVSSGMDIPESSSTTVCDWNDPLLQQTLSEVVVVAALQELPILKATIDEHVSSFKHMVEEESVFQSEYSNDFSEMSLREKVRDFAAIAAHGTLEAVSQFASCVPEFMEELKTAKDKILPYESARQPDNMLFLDKTMGSYEDLIAAGHEKIDQIFSTQYAEGYASASKERSLEHDMNIGIIPPPGKFFKEQNLSKARDLIRNGQKTVAIAEELGLTSREIIQLKQESALEKTVASTFEEIVSDSEKLRSCERYKKAEAFVKPYQGKYLPEHEIRELLREAGVNTFERPIGIPGNYKTKLADKSGGMKYVHPDNEGTYVRVMPGKPHSPFPHQREPYINHRINGQSVDKFGNVVPNDAVEAHIPISEFIYRGSQ